MLLYDPRAIFSFEDNDVVIPLVVLEEIDKLKTQRYDDAGRNARATNRILDELRAKGSLMEGVSLPNGGMLRIVREEYRPNQMPVELDSSKIDNHIIFTALGLASEVDTPVHLITKDISMRLKCDMLGLKCDDYLKHRVASDSDLVYGGLRVISTTPENVNSLFQNKNLPIENLKSELDIDLLPNEFVVLKGGESQSGLTRYHEGTKSLNQIVKHRDVWGLEPRNKEQQFALDVLMDSKIDLVSLIGPAGTGKTLLAIAAGIKQVLEDQLYSRLIVTRPIQPVGKDIGYLPGTKEEKMEPWVQPVVDNLQQLFGHNGGHDTLYHYFQKGIIEVEAITYIRGRSIPNAFVIIDEAQNLSVHELKTIITRVGEGTKIVLTGDIDQIDNNLIDAVSNGLTYAVEKFKPYDLAAHITLIKGERSKLASLAATIL